MQISRDAGVNGLHLAAASVKSQHYQRILGTGDKALAQSDKVVITRSIVSVAAHTGSEDTTLHVTYSISMHKTDKSPKPMITTAEYFDEIASSTKSAEAVKACAMTHQLLASPPANGHIFLGTISGYARSFNDPQLVVAISNSILTYHKKYKKPKGGSSTKNARVNGIIDAFDALLKDGDRAGARNLAQLVSDGDDGQIDASVEAIKERARAASADPALSKSVRP